MTHSGSSGFLAQPVIGEFASSGTLANKITIKAFPGASPIIFTTDGMGFFVRGNHVRIHGLWFATAKSTVNNGAGIISIGDYTTVDSNFFLGMTGDGNNNDACVYFTHTAGGKGFRNVFKDCKAYTGTNRQNLSAINWLDDVATASECFDHEAKWNGITWTTANDSLAGNAFMFKHGCQQADVGVNKHPVQYNRISNSYRVFRYESSSLRFSNNIAVNSTEIGLQWADGSSEKQQDNEITDNTFVDMSQLAWDPPAYSAPEKLTILRNVFRDNRSGYAGSGHEGIISIDGYGSAGNKTTFETAPFYLSSDNNCFYNPNTALTWSYFSDGSGGGQFSFANWKLRAVPYDAASVVENPLFDTFYQATSANCLNKGIQFTAAVVSSGTTNNLNVAHRIMTLKRRKAR